VQYLVLEGIGCGFAFAGTSLFFEFVDKGGVLTPLENGVLAMTFITVIVAVRTRTCFAAVEQFSSRSDH